MKAVSRLQGKRIAVTRAAERAEGLASALRAEGAEVRICPTIAYNPPEDPDHDGTEQGRDPRSTCQR